MKVRESNIELLRIVLMTIIIVWHLFVYGESFLQTLATPSIYIAPLLVFPVDCFVFISGFYGLKLKRDKLISLLCMLVTYSILICIATTLSRGTFDIRAFAFSFFPVSTNYWYFFTLYVLLLIISPMLNVCDNWDKAYFKKMLMLTGFFYLGIMSLLFGTKTGCIGDLPLFIFIYLTGKYLKRFPVKLLISHRIILCLTLYVVSYLSVFVFQNDTQWVIRCISYNNPVVVLMAIEFFYLFKMLKLGTNRVVNMISSTVFASYIVTESSLRNIYIQSVSHLCVGGGKWLYIILAILTIFFICPIELIRKKIFAGLIKWLTCKSYKII
ncbi:acyltransferase family protein [Bacteroides uniformis]|jgi:hypothetical protein|uniref:acyltransferase family protein n=2 Tax=Bacteroidia TaxID=200643 RepID=UPI0039B64702